MATTTNARLETTPTGTTNVSGLINGNTGQIEKILNPDNTEHAYTGAVGDVGNLIRDTLFRDAVEALASGAAQSIDFAKEPIKTLTVNVATTTFTVANLGAGKFVALKLTADGTNRALVWPGAVTFVTPGSTTLAANKTAWVELHCYDGTSIIGRYFEETDATTAVAGEFGSITAESNATATTISASSTDFTNKVQVTTFGTDGASSTNITPDHTNDHLTAVLAGNYRIEFRATVNGTAADEISAAIFKNNGATQLGIRSTVQIGSGGEKVNLVVTATVALSASDTVEVWLQNETGTNDPTIEDAELEMRAV